MMKWRNAELTKNFSELLDSQGEDPWLMNHEIYKLNTKISASQVLAQKGKQKIIELLNKWFQKNITNTYHYSMKRKVNDSHQQELGTTRSK